MTCPLHISLRFHPPNFISSFPLPSVTPQETLCPYSSVSTAVHFLVLTGRSHIGWGGEEPLVSQRPRMEQELGQVKEDEKCYEDSLHEVSWQPRTAPRAGDGGQRAVPISSVSFAVDRGQRWAGIQRRSRLVLYTDALQPHTLPS